MRTISCLFLFLIVSTLTFAQRSTPLDSRVSDILGRLKEKDLPAREAAFGELMTLISEEDRPAEASGQSHSMTGFFSKHPNQADQVKLGLIQLLGSENNIFTTGPNTIPGTHTEEDGEYYAELIDTISSLDDERAIPALVGAMTTGGMAKRGILKYGDKALGPVLEQLQNPDGLVRAAALGMSISLLKNQNDPASQLRALDIIQSALTDSASVVRGHAVREIDCLADRQKFVSTLEKIARTDPEKFAGKALDGGDGEEFYPVRYDARRVLRDIQNNKSCTP
jgi:hypothetical protein